MLGKNRRVVRLLVLAFTLIIAFGACEVLARFVGIIDFPLYRTSSSVGYYLSPGQRGSFLRLNKWYVNSDGFNNEAEFRADLPYVLLVGDSVAYGGNPIDYYSRIGTIVSRQIQEDVWVAAVGGWSLYNELAYIGERNRAISAAGAVVFIFDNGDLDGLAPWQGEHVHPTHYPRFASIYAARRYILPKFGVSSRSELPPIPSNVIPSADEEQWVALLDGFFDSYHGSVLFLLYPDQSALNDTKLWHAQTEKIRAYLGERRPAVGIIDLGLDPDWHAGLYRDGIHPSVEGNKVLAAKISDWIQMHR